VRGICRISDIFLNVYDGLCLPELFLQLLILSLKFGNATGRWIGSFNFWLSLPG